MMLTAREGSRSYHFAIALGFASAFLASGCGVRVRSLTAAVNLAVDSGAGTLVVVSGSTFVGTLREATIQVSGGIPPYTYQVISGQGAVASAGASHGIFTAPSSVVGNSETDTVRVTDMAGNSKEISFTVANAATLDSTFGVGGKVGTAIGTSSDTGQRVLILSDGKIVQVGYAGIGGLNAATITRHLETGALDPSFGTAGKTTVSFPQHVAIFSAVEQPDHKILVSGYIQSVGTANDILVIRFNADGTVDGTFGTSGFTTVSLGSKDDSGFTLGLQSTGKIVIAGQFEVPATNKKDLSFIRLDATGALDPSFGTSGVFTAAVGTGNDLIKGMKILDDDSIVAVGMTTTGNISSVVVKLTPDGAFDASFASGGKYVNSFDAASDYFETLHIQADGKIVVAGFRGSPADMHVIRLTENGALDGGFGSGGSLVIPVLAGNNYIYSMAELPDGSLVYGGYAHNGANNDFAVARSDANGVLDPTFNGVGYQTFAVGAGEDRCLGVSVDSMGRVILSGYSHNGTDTDFALLRIWP